MPTPYKYHCRPGYNVDDLLLDFFLEGDSTQFIAQLLAAVKDLKVSIHFLQDVSLHGVTLYTMLVDQAECSLSIEHNLDRAFIQSSQHQAAIKMIDQALITSQQFKKEAVDFNNYRTAD